MGRDIDHWASAQREHANHPRDARRYHFVCLQADSRSTSEPDLASMTAICVSRSNVSLVMQAAANGSFPCGDDYRGVILEDHLAKGLKQHLSYSVTPSYEEHMPECQHGATRGRSTDFATHLVREAIAHAEAAKLCIFILFLDLVKAFDRIIREVTLGWPAGAVDAREYLRSLGLSDEQSEWIAGFVSVHGCLFEQWGVDPKVTRLLKNMHMQSWFSYGSVDSAVATRVGGRQGCKFGATLFNSTFSVALILIHDALVDAGIVFRFRSDSAPPWCQTEPPADSQEEHVLDAAFVDDTVLILFAVSPKLLGRAIDMLLLTVCRVYKVLNLTINWKPGKTEAILQYRGQHAAASLRARRPSLGEPPVIAVPSSTDLLHIVSEYKHLGGEITASGSLVPLASGRRKRALAAYAPLAMKIFGSEFLDLGLRQWLFNTLVMSRLLFNLHVVAPSRRLLTILNDVYLRGHRRMHNSIRVEGGGETDLGFRTRTRTPSIDCVLCRQRLRYLARLLRASPPSLMALLRQRPRGRRGAWMNLIVADLGRIQTLVARCSKLPAPECDPAAWASYILEDAVRWKQDVQLLFFTESVCDRETPKEHVDLMKPFVCSECSVAFATSKQYGMHRRRVHGERCAQRVFALPSGECQACHTVFGTRLALLGHLCDSRRRRCWERILASPEHFQQLSPAEVDRLDALDTVARAEGRRHGHTHALVRGGCVRADGRPLGRPSN